MVSLNAWIVGCGHVDMDQRVLSGFQQCLLLCRGIPPGEQNLCLGIDISAAFKTREISFKSLVDGDVGLCIEFLQRWHETRQEITILDCKGEGMHGS